MLWLALAALFSLPVPADKHAPDIRAVFTTDDIPANLEVSGIVYTRTTVGPDGKTQGCAAEVSSGDKWLDAYTCGVIVRRVRFLPARWTDGSPVYGVIRAPVSWTVGASDDAKHAPPPAPDLEISVNRLPEGADRIVAVELEVAADDNGQPVGCALFPPLKDYPQPQYPELVPLACQQVMNTYTLTPPLDALGKPARSIQTVSVLFKTGH